MNSMKCIGSKLATIAKNGLARASAFALALMAFVSATNVAKADDISDTTTTVSGYVTAAIVVGIAVLLFVLGRKVLRRLICVAFMGWLVSSNAWAATDIAGVTSSVSGYVTAAIVVGISVLLFVLGRKVLRRLI